MQHTVTVAAPASTMHVAGVVLHKAGTGPWHLTARGRIHDTLHALLPGVQVTGQWWLPSGVKVYRTSTTDAQGVFQAQYPASAAGQCRFCVVGLAKAGYTYVRADNHPPVPCQWVTVP